MIMVNGAEAHALIEGEIVVGFVERGSVDIGDEIKLAVDDAATDMDIKPAYRRSIDRPLPPGDWYGVVDSVDPAAILDPEAGQSRHVRASAPTSGDIVVLRVYGPDGPALTDTAFEARRKSVQGALQH